MIYSYVLESGSECLIKYSAAESQVYCDYKDGCGFEPLLSFGQLSWLRWLDRSFKEGTTRVYDGIEPIKRMRKNGF